MVTTLSVRPRRGPQNAASRTETVSQLTDEQWLLIEDLFPVEPMTRAGGRPWVPPRPCLEGILWILTTGARWKDLPKCFPSPSTCWRRLRDWTNSGVFREAWTRVLKKLDGLQEIDWEEEIADGTFAPAKKGGFASARPRRARGPRSWSSPTAMACR